MICPQCNRPVSQDTAFCPTCGMRIAGTFSNTEPSQYSNQYPPMGSSHPGYTNTQYSYPPATTLQPEMPMKWYKWLKVVLIIGAVANFLSIFSYIGEMDTLSQFSPLQYALIPGLEDLVGTMRVLFIIMIIYSLGFGIFSIYVQRQLAGYKKNAPKMVVLMYTVSAVVGSIVNVILASQMEEVFGDVMGMSAQIDTYYTSAVGGFVGGMLMAILNSKYFKKREHLFVN